MKRHGSSDSLGALMSVCPTSGLNINNNFVLYIFISLFFFCCLISIFPTPPCEFLFSFLSCLLLKPNNSQESLRNTLLLADEQSPRNSHVYGREFQSMLDGLDEEGSMEEQCHVGEKKRRLSVDQVKALEKTFEIENKLEPDRKVKLALELGLQPRQVAVWFQNRRARWKTKQLERDYGLLKANYETLKRSFDTLQQDNDALLKEVHNSKIPDSFCSKFEVFFFPQFTCLCFID